MRALLPALLALLTACGTDGFQGTIVDGLNGEKPLADIELIAKAGPDASLTCQADTAKSDANGAFKFEKACTSQFDYTLKTRDESWWLADTAAAPKGTAAPLKVVAWHTGGSPGLHHRKADGTVGSVSTGADLKSDILLDKDEKVWYPKSVDRVPVIAPGEHLIFNGKDAAEKLVIHPMFQSGARKFGTSKEPVTISSPWWYIDVEFTSDTEFARKTATVDEAKVKSKAHEDKATKWIAGDALPAGRYAIYAEGDRRAYIVDFGAAAPPLPAAAP